MTSATAADAACAEQGKLTDEAVAALDSTGVLRALRARRPARWGGGEADLADTVIEIGRASASDTPAAPTVRVPNEHQAPTPHSPQNSPQERRHTDEAMRDRATRGGVAAALVTRSRTRAST
ncbi:hypothetical protein [Actinomadura verrucosospora]|uniref:hypothetical protein n=1 Tax=Actinomadura verrucosospora TaxID=46165 RepID=UPI001564CDED|nr:hypothetical protein [Actinomadura verrucosospora]